ncbi:MAG: HipA domain-containing protein [Bifidobacterium aquikefiri]|uniref:HipA domain-containing protein n=1 Tax=Bifidobacterium aquikefiri TaxID=1653207 RepID=A0A261G5X9_9BIFI|nr:HipA domain-containing protein [Bifidobacterium aquikefiri]OZG66822.1 HipA domain-containing protein [Bifidobacterium aquikefiri]
MRVLHAWLEGTYVGRFIRSADRHTVFEYAGDYPSSPISLSLPRNGRGTRKAAGNFLENLLPDNPAMREVMARNTGAASTDVFDLLDHADTTGGLVFSSTENMPVLEDEPPVLATDDEIASRISTLNHAGTAWWESGLPSRFSLAGNQPKFTLARVGDDWYWPNAALPSTHIFKPESTHIKGAEMIEAASLRLGGLVGLPAPDAGVMNFEDRHAYVVRRFDRAQRNGETIRVHVEDFMQSLGGASNTKYDISAKRILRLLSDVDPSLEMSYEWLRRLAFNTSIANADAHAKNYSAMLRPGQLSLSPLYDTITTRYWPTFNQNLAMPISGAVRPEQITPFHWAKLARQTGLDSDRAVTTAQKIAGAVVAHAPEAYEGLEAPMRGELLKIIALANARIEPKSPET